MRFYKMKHCKKAWLNICVIMIPVFSHAQQGNIGDEQINVIKPYQPTLSDAFKISDIPERDTSVSYTPDMKYDVNPVQHPTIYTITPIKPVRIKDENIKELYRGFVKAGYGTKNTPYAELFYNSIRSKSFDAGVHLSHISSTGKIKGFGYPGMSESGASVFGSRFFENSLLNGELGYRRSVYHWYGYNEPPDLFSKSETKHSFDDIYGDVKFGSNDKDKDKFRYSAQLGFYNFSDNKSNDETRFNLAGGAGKLFDNYDISATGSLDFLRYDTDLFNPQSYHIVRLKPRISTDYENLKLTAGTNLALEINDENKVHIYPFARIDLELIEEMLSTYVQLSGDLERNTFKNLSYENPFLGTFVPLANTSNKFDVTGGIKAKINQQFAFNASARIARLKDDIFFRNIPGPSTMVLYDVIYDDNTHTNVHAEIVYEQNEKAGLSLGVDYFSNKPSRETEALFRPDFRLTLSAFYNIGTKIYISTQWYYTGSQFARAYVNGIDYLTLKGYTDGNLTVDYRYSKVLSVFLNLNNVTASKYARWYNYPSYRFSAMAGFTYSF